MNTKTVFIAIALLIAIPNLVFGQKLLEEKDVKSKRFGNDVFYTDLLGNSLDGHYKIADSRGNYQDLHFKKGKKHGECTRYDYAGRLKSKSSYKNGKAEGKFTLYHQNGKVFKQGNFKNGEEEGKWEHFNDKGKLQTVENYKNGKKSGKWWRKIKGFQYEGEITEHYKDDQLFGHAEEKSTDGKLKWEREYKNNMSYKETKYYPNGKKSETRILEDGKLKGNFIIYNQDGIMINKKVFKNDFLLSHTTFFENGNTKELTNFKDGKKSGAYELYNEKGVKIEEGQYKDNYKDGIWKEYDGKTEVLLSETNYVDNVKNGTAKTYNEAQRVASEGKYKNGEKDGLWKHYNLAGKLIKEVVYDLGKEKSVKEFK